MQKTIKNKNKKVLVAMSGGVDSGVSAKILQDQGYECLGVFMCFAIDGKCCDMSAARRICQKLGIKFYPIDLSFAFKKRVKDYFLNSYRAGITPNPCVNCNKYIKFGELLKVAKRLKADYLATGHYIKLKKVKGVYKVYRAEDMTKDQTYFLYNLTQDQLKYLIFPMADKIKEDIKQEAKKNKLPHIKGESQDVCFLPDDHNVYLKNNLKLKSGEIKTMDGKVVGQHSGLPLYTVGQRRGIEIGGIGPFYVASMDYKTNTLYVVNDGNDKALYRDILEAGDVNWVSGIEPKMPFSCKAMIRYRHQEQPCTISKKGKKYIVKFKKPQRAVTAGQSVVFYKGKELLGGGVIFN